MIEINWKIMFKWKVNWVEWKYSKKVKVHDSVRLKRKNKIRNNHFKWGQERGKKESKDSKARTNRKSNISFRNKYNSNYIKCTWKKF